MARTSRKSKLALPTVAHKRFSYEQRTSACTRAAKIAARAVVEEIQFVEDADGHLIRQWKASELQTYTSADIVQAIRGRHVVETEDMLEYIPPSAIKYAVTKGWLFPDGPFYRVTRKAAAELDLPRSVGGRKICFYDAGL